MIGQSTTIKKEPDSHVLSHEQLMQLIIVDRVLGDSQWCTVQICNRCSAHAQYNLQTCASNV